MWKECEDIMGGFYGAFLGTIVGAIVALVLCLISYMIPDKNTYELVETREIYALEDSSIVAVRPYLYSVQNGDSFVYRYVYKDEIGYRIGTVGANSTAIIYSENPRIETYKVHFANKFHDFFSFRVKEFRVYVPEGTIATQNYSIDLK